MSTQSPSRYPTGQAPGGEAVLFSGLRHLPIGGAHLEVRDGVLLATGFSEGGEDGLQIELGRSAGFVPEIELPADGIQEGGRVVSRTWGRVDGEEGRLTVAVTLERIGEGVQITPDFSAIGAPTYELQLFRDGVLVHRQAGMSGPAGTALGFAARRRRACCRVLVYSYNFLTELPFLTTEGETVMADSGFFIDENPTKRVDHLSAVTFTARSVSELHFHPGDLAVFDPFVGHLSLGGAVLGAEPGRLLVSGLGDGGDDGVRVGWKKARAWQVHLAPPNAESSPVDGIRWKKVRSWKTRLGSPDAESTRNASLRFTSYGSLGGKPEQPLGTAQIEGSNGMFRAAFDFSPLQARRVTLEVRNQEETVCYQRGLIDATVRLGGSAGTLTPSYSTSLTGGSRTLPLSATLAWAEPIKLSLADGTEVVGDEVVAYPETLATDIESSFLSNLDVQATGLEGFSLVGETVERVTEAGPAFTAR